MRAHHHHADHQHTYAVEAAWRAAEREVDMFDGATVGTVLDTVSRNLVRLTDYVMQPSNDTNEEMRRHTLNVMKAERDVLDDLIENIDGYEVEAADR